MAYNEHNNSNLTTVELVRVVQTGNKSNYWSITEFYVANLDLSRVDGVMADDVYSPLTIPADCLEQAIVLRIIAESAGIPSDSRIFVIIGRYICRLLQIRLDWKI